MTEDLTQRRLEREARERCLGILGDRAGVNVAKVEVSWYVEEWEPELTLREGAGHYLVHATGDEPQCQGEEGTVYAVFEDLVSQAMEVRASLNHLHGWQIDDISSV